MPIITAAQYQQITANTSTATTDPNFVITAIQSAVEDAIRSIMNYVTTLKASIDSGDITGAIILIIEAAIPLFVVFVVIDLLTIKILGSGLDLSGLKAFLTQFFKADLLMSAVVGAWVGAGLKSPAEQIANKFFRPAIMSVSLATYAYNSGQITEAQWRDKLARWGVPDLEMPTISFLESTKPEIGTIARYVTLVDVSDSDLDTILNNSAVIDPNVRDFYKKYIRAAQLRDEYLQSNAIYKSAYLNGLITETVLMQELLFHKGSSVEAQTVLQNCELQMNYSLTESEIATRTWLYRKGVYTAKGALLTPIMSGEDYFYNQLAALGVNLAVVNSIVRLEASKNGVDYERP